MVFMKELKLKGSFGNKLSISSLDRQVDNAILLLGEVTARFQ
jgi:hypothetical protein